MKTKLTKKEQERVRDWCSGWFTLNNRGHSLAEYIMLKLSVDQSTAERYATWLQAEHAKEKEGQA